MKILISLMLIGGATLSAAQLHGQVTDASGAPVAGAVVVLQERNGLSQEKVTNELGDYTFDKLEPAAYSVRVVKAGFRTDESQRIKVKGSTKLDRRLAVPTPVRTVAD
jgi:protocatechuate 3,4-dioxygenase beta subunit